jgi:hypothetical protein
MNASGIIRKISIGDIKEGITYKVGQSMLGGRITIEQIMQDLESLQDYGINKFDVFVSENGSDNVRIWKSFMNVPTSIEFDISIENETS